jgi:hypothetical protein
LQPASTTQFCGMRNMYQFLLNNHRVSPVLAKLGSINFLLFVVLAVLLPFNRLEVLGINSLIKPMKFAVSIAIFSHSMAWLLQYLNDRKAVRKYSWMMVFTLGFEQAVITLQALRGQKSHFNMENTLGIILFSLMGLFIMLATAYTTWIWLIMLRQPVSRLRPAMWLAARKGLFLFVVFSLFGGLISAYGRHTVGAPDGSAGLPFLNWSLDYGDLRIAHFFGVHSLQVLPLFVALFVRGDKPSDLKRVNHFSLVWLLLVCFTAVQALLGFPLF